MINSLIQFILQNTKLLLQSQKINLKICHVQEKVFCPRVYNLDDTYPTKVLIFSHVSPVHNVLLAMEKIVSHTYE